MSAIVGRVLRERRERAKRVIVERPKPTDDAMESCKVDDTFNLHDSCFLPCVRGPWLCIGMGMFLISLGALLCYFAFHSDLYSSIPSHSNSTTDGRPATIFNQSLLSFLKSFSYIGPTVIGIGAFVIIVSCVMVFDKREQILKVLKSRELQMNKKSKDSVYNAVMTRYLRKNQGRNASASDNAQSLPGRSDVHGFAIFGCASEGNTASPSDYKHITALLKGSFFDDSVKQKMYRDTSAGVRDFCDASTFSVISDVPVPSVSCLNNDGGLDVEFVGAQPVSPSLHDFSTSGGLAVRNERDNPSYEGDCQTSVPITRHSEETEVALSRSRVDSPVKPGPSPICERLTHVLL